LEAIAMLGGYIYSSVYTDIHCRKLRVAVSANEKFGPDCILFGNGAANINYRMCFALRPKTTLLTAPTFSDHEQAFRNIGCKIGYYGLSPENSFAVGTGILEQVSCKDIVFV